MDDGKHPVLILTHNALELTNRALSSIFGQDIPVHVFVVDNNSTDGTVPYLEELGCQVFAAKWDMGVSRAWNYGLGYFFQQGEDHVLVVNNDVILRPETYSELILDGGLFVTGVGVNESEQFTANFIKTIRPNPDFSCFLMKREAWEKVGMFDESMILYASDCDYHVRMHKEGIEAYTIGMPFFHTASGTIKRNPEEAGRIIEQANRDRIAFYEKWGVGIGTPEYYELFK